ncbi:MAG: hypothetical protein PHO74_03235 [Weeksellaceae bacterium]|nr:hypothetical protein [Weeksellaceae bacterium]
MRTRFFFLLLFLIALSVAAQRTLIIETDSHQHIYFDEEKDEPVVLSVEKSWMFFGIDEAATLLTQKSSESDELLKYNITDSTFDELEMITTYYMIDQEGFECLATLDKPRQQLIIAYINGEDKVMMNLYEIQKLYFSDKTEN